MPTQGRSNPGNHLSWIANAMDHTAWAQSFYCLETEASYSAWYRQPDGTPIVRVFAEPVPEPSCFLLVAPVLAAGLCLRKAAAVQSVRLKAARNGDINLRLRERIVRLKWSIPMRILFIWLAGLLLLHAADVSAPVERPVVRKQAPDFALLDAEGKLVALSSFRGKPVLLDLWATKCGGCVKEIPYFIDIHRAYGRKRLAVIGVSMDILYEDLKGGPAEAWRLVKPFIAGHNVTYPILMSDDRFTTSYSVTTLPVTYLIDKHGRIAATYTGVVDRADIEKNIKSLIGER